MKTIPALAFLLALLACNTPDNKKNTSEANNSATEVSKTTTGGEGCYLPYQPKVCELVDKETIAQILGVDAAKMEVQDAMKMLHEMGKNKDKPYKGSEFTVCEYKWQDKTKKIKEYVEQLGTKIEVSMYALVQVGNFAPRKDVAAFKQHYRDVSEDELNEALGKAGEQMEKGGKYSKEEIGTAKNMGKGLAEGRTVTYLDNLGEAAASIRTKAYGEQTEVVVYYKGNEFQVEVKMAGKTHAENMEYTLKIAEEVLKRCK